MEFDFSKWRAELARVPEEHLNNCLNAIVEEPKRRQAERLMDQRDLTNTQQDWALDPESKPAFTMNPAEEAPAWVPPIGLKKCYPPQACVSHVGFVWSNALAKLNDTEPGEEEPAWLKIRGVDEPMPDSGIGAVGPSGTLENPTPWEAGLMLSAGQIISCDGMVFESLRQHATESYLRPGGPGLGSYYKKIA